MAKVSTDDLARRVEALLEGGAALIDARATIGLDKDEDLSTWQRVCAVVYNNAVRADRKKRNEFIKKKRGLATTNDEVQRIIDVNQQLTTLALQIPEASTIRDVEMMEELLPQLPASEPAIVSYIGRYIMSPRMRALQKHGRYSKLVPFQPFTKIVDAATLSYFRNNFISCFLTLAPVVEGVMLRWLGFTGGSDKPEFEDLRKFFRQGPTRQPRPHDAEFHQLHSAAADVILNRHLFRPTETGSGHENFNRHQAAHLLSDVEFATKANCIRLFVLLDIMTELYVHESRQPDPRFTTDVDSSSDMEVYEGMLFEQAAHPLAEDALLKPVTPASGAYCSFRMNVYQMYAHLDNQVGFWIVRDSWGNTLAQVREIEGTESGQKLPGRAPYHGNPRVFADVYNTSGQLLQARAVVSGPGTYAYELAEPSPELLVAMGFVVEAPLAPAAEEIGVAQ